MPVQSTSIEGYSVVLYPGKCFVSKGYAFATLEEVRRTGHMHNNGGGEAHVITPHVLELIQQWAKAHGYIKERISAGTQISRYAAATPEARWFIGSEQRALPFEVPAAKPRRCARPAGNG